jgi:hypothetical protein
LKVLTFRFGITVTKMTASQKKRNAGLKQQGIMMYTVAKGSNAANDVLKKTARSIEDELERAKALSLETKRREDKLPDSEPQMEVGTPSKKLIKTNRNRMPDLRLKSVKKRNLKRRPTLRRKNDPKTDRERSVERHSKNSSTTTPSTRFRATARPKTSSGTSSSICRSGKRPKEESCRPLSAPTAETFTPGPTSMKISFEISSR